MAPFDDWQRWGIDLSDREFASAWAALGVVAAQALGKARAIEDVLGAALARSREAEGELPWRFPPVRARAAERPLRAQPPGAWAAAWSRMAGQHGAALALRVTGAPEAEPLAPWYRLLREADPAPASAALALRAPQAELRIGWPLQWGSLEDAEAAALIALARRDWPANELSRGLAIDREARHCDVLVASGGTRALLAKLLARPGAVRADLVLLPGALEASWGEERARLEAILSETRASGFLVVQARRGHEGLAPLLNRFLAEISHAMRLDAAFEQSARGIEGIDPVAGFTDALARFRLLDIVPRLNRRLAELPGSVTLDLSRVGDPREWLTTGVSGGGRAGGEALPAPGADRSVAASSVRVDARTLEVTHESGGGRTLAAIAEALEEAPAAGAALSQARYLQQQAFVRVGGQTVAAAQGFVAGAPALVRVRIGPENREWNALPEAFPEEALPKNREYWRLQVWLTEPRQLEAPLVRTIRLPRRGASSECEFRFRPKAAGAFEGRLTVLHRGRVLQTAVLRAAVRDAGQSGSEAAAPELAELIPVRGKLGDLKSRREFDLAVVLNETARGEPLAAGLARDHAWLVNLTEARKIAGEINALISRVARSVADYRNGFEDEKGRALLVELARKGRWLHLYLIEQQLQASGNRPKVAAQEYVQIVSTKSEAVVPFEFIYEYETPEPAATLCPGWRRALEEGGCGGACRGQSSEIVCPLGFWGLSKVIERHALTPQLARDGRELFLQSEPDSARDALSLAGKALYGSSSRVKASDLEALARSLQTATGTAAAVASDWASWRALVTAEKPALLIALPHTDGAGSSCSLELGGKTLQTIDVNRSYVRPDAAAAPPIVALLGCDTTGTADDYGNHVLVFRARGAAVVIGTIATVFGEHAARVATLLVEGLLAPTAPQRLGEALRALKRRAVLEGLLMPLCLVAYGDADWRLKRN